MKQCDLCSKAIPDSGMLKISAVEFRKAVKAGLRPPATDDHDSPDAMVMRGLGIGGDTFVEQWLERVQSDSSDWGLCDECYPEASKRSQASEDAAAPARDKTPAFAQGGFPWPGSTAFDRYGVCFLFLMAILAVISAGDGDFWAGKRRPPTAGQVALEVLMGICLIGMVAWMARMVYFGIKQGKNSKPEATASIPTREDPSVNDASAIRIARAMAYLHTCGPFTEKELREVNRIGELSIPESGIQMMIQQAQMIMPTETEPGGMEAIRESIREQLVTLSKALKNSEPS